MATWFAVVDGSGNLVSTGTLVADAVTLAAAGYTAVQLANDPSGQAWNPATKTFSPVQPTPRPLSVWQFVQRFTPDEFGAVDSSNDHQTRQFLLMLTVAQSISTSDPVVQGALQYLVKKGILTADRAATIGAP